MAPVRICCNLNVQILDDSVIRYNPQSGTYNFSIMIVPSRDCNPSWNKLDLVVYNNGRYHFLRHLDLEYNTRIDIRLIPLQFAEMGFNLDEDLSLQFTINAFCGESQTVVEKYFSSPYVTVEKLPRVPDTSGCCPHAVKIVDYRIEGNDIAIDILIEPLYSHCNTRYSRLEIGFSSPSFDPLDMIGYKSIETYERNMTLKFPIDPNNPYNGIQAVYVFYCINNNGQEQHVNTGTDYLARRNVVGCCGAQDSQFFEILSTEVIEEGEFYLIKYRAMPDCLYDVRKWSVWVYNPRDNQQYRLGDYITSNLPNPFVDPFVVKLPKNAVRPAYVSSCKIKYTLRFNIVCYGNENRDEDHDIYFTINDCLEESCKLLGVVDDIRLLGENYVYENANLEGVELERSRHNKLWWQIRFRVFFHHFNYDMIDGSRLYVYDKDAEKYIIEGLPPSHVDSFRNHAYYIVQDSFLESGRNNDGYLFLHLLNVKSYKIELEYYCSGIKRIELGLSPISGIIRRPTDCYRDWHSWGWHGDLDPVRRCSLMYLCYPTLHYVRIGPYYMLSFILTGRYMHNGRSDIYTRREMAVYFLGNVKDNGFVERSGYYSRVFTISRFNTWPSLYLDMSMRCSEYYDDILNDRIAPPYGIYPLSSIYNLDRHSDDWYTNIRCVVFEHTGDISGLRAVVSLGKRIGYIYYVDGPVNATNSRYLDVNKSLGYIYFDTVFCSEGGEASYKVSKNSVRYDRDERKFYFRLKFMKHNRLYKDIEPSQMLDDTYNSINTKDYFDCLDSEVHLFVLYERQVGASDDKRLVVETLYEPWGRNTRLRHIIARFDGESLGYGESDSDGSTYIEFEYVHDAGLEDALERNIGISLRFHDRRISGYRYWSWGTPVVFLSKEHFEGLS